MYTNEKHLPFCSKKSWKSYVMDRFLVQNINGVFLDASWRMIWCWDLDVWLTFFVIIIIIIIINIIIVVVVVFVILLLLLLLFVMSQVDRVVINPGLVTQCKNHYSLFDFTS